MEEKIYLAEMVSYGSILMFVKATSQQEANI